MSDLFKGFEQLVELAKVLEEKIDKGEIKTEMQFNTRPLSNIPRSGGIPRPGGIPRTGNPGSDIGTSRIRTQPPSDSSSGDVRGESDSVSPPEDASLKDIGG